MTGVAAADNLVGLPLFVQRTVDALTAIQGLGLRWQATRFDSYLRHIRVAAKLTYPRPFPWEGDAEGQRLFFEAASQCHQLVDSSPVWQAAKPSLAKSRLERVLKGCPLPPQDPEKPDDSRNVLFELATAASLRRNGFAVEIPASDEDLRAAYPGLKPFLVECKRPAHDNSLAKNLKAARNQLKKRRTIRAIGVTGDSRVFPHASIGGLLLTGAIFPADRGVLFTMSLLRLFCVGDESHYVSRKISSVFQGSGMPMMAGSLG